MWINCNPNPKRKHVPDCVIRALVIALNKSWYDVHDELCALSREECSVTCDDNVWGKYLIRYGFEEKPIQCICPDCVTVSKFAEEHPKGRYVLACQDHVVAVDSGSYFDTWDSGDLPILYYYEKEM